MAKRNSEEFNEENTVDVSEVTAGEEKPKRKPSPKTEARNNILSYVTENMESLPSDLQDLVKVYNSVPGRSSGGSQSNSVAARIRKMFEEYEEIHEDKFYDEFKIGRLEMKRRIYNLRKKNSDPSDNVYVSFDPETGIYKVEGKGATPPEAFED